MAMACSRASAAPATAQVEWTAGTFTLGPGAQLNGAGLYRLNGGTVTANTNLNLENLDLVHSSSTFGGSGVMTVVSQMNWTAGTMSGGSRTIISPGATLNAAAGACQVRTSPRSYVRVVGTRPTCVLKTR